MSQTWAQCLNTLKDTIPLSQYSVWVQPLKALEDKETLSLMAPNNQVKDYINKNLKTQIKSAVHQHNKDLKIFIGVAPTKKPSLRTIRLIIWCLVMLIKWHMVPLDKLQKI